MLNIVTSVDPDETLFVNVPFLHIFFQKPPELSTWNFRQATQLTLNIAMHCKAISVTLHEIW